MPLQARAPGANAGRAEEELMKKEEKDDGCGSQQAHWRHRLLRGSLGCLHTRLCASAEVIWNGRRRPIFPTCAFEDYLSPTDLSDQSNVTYKQAHQITPEWYMTQPCRIKCLLGCRSYQQIYVCIYMRSYYHHLQIPQWNDWFVPNLLWASSKERPVRSAQLRDQ